MADPSPNDKRAQLLQDEKWLNGGELARQNANEGDPTPTAAAANETLQTIAGMMGNVLESRGTVAQDANEGKSDTNPRLFAPCSFGFFSDVIATVFFPPSDEYDQDGDGVPDMGGEIDTNNLVRSFAVYGGARPLAISDGLLQGMSVGGQLPASLIYTVEMRPQAHWGYYGALVMMAANCDLSSHDFQIEWGWRLPFLSGILIAFVAMYLRDYGKEHNPNSNEYGEDNEDDENNEKHHLGEVFKRENLPALGAATLTPTLYGAGFYLTFVWMAIYMGVLLEEPIEHSFWINAGALLFGVIIPMPIAGILSDRLGRSRTMMLGAYGLAIFGPVMIKLISTGKAFNAFFAQWTLGVFISIFGGPMNAWLVESFPPKVRLTSAALGYDLAHCTASAFSPLVATVLVKDFGSTSVGLMYPFFALLAICGMHLSNRIHKDGGVETLETEMSAGVENAEKKVYTVT
ncbi:hypothetical protein THAOC_11535 [Thalassiosira oceanica]|uniref:Major facilitator superfamily (MFS) profile domain-containing protein n=1 Tax=Thalassiosira oceanica TaxID=159749 RepID=K0SM93_THAOC|nr:hypothetical protein THAOC_11535 [Thalassiosira oceanica]|eukprot:EJK67433.1 hypothetical protein THAOC_11535 [Thalassiosira oceanica]